MNKDMAQVNMVRPESDVVDGKIWSQNNGFAALHRLDLKTGAIETIAPFTNSKTGENHNIYDIIPDSANNVYFTDFAQQHIGKVDAKTGQTTLFELPTKASAPRRGMMDAQGRIWFGLYRGNKIDMFDTKSETFKEWEMPTSFSAPYDVTIDKNGDVWTGSMLNDRVSRLNHRDRHVRRIFAAARDQHPPRLRGQHDDAGDVLGRQQSPGLDHQSRTAGVDRHSPEEQGSPHERSDMRDTFAYESTNAEPGYRFAHPGYAFIFGLQDRRADHPDVSEADRARGAARQVDVAAARKWPAVIDRHDR